MFMHGNVINSNTQCRQDKEELRGRTSEEPNVRASSAMVPGPVSDPAGSGKGAEHPSSNQGIKHEKLL